MSDIENHTSTKMTPFKASKKSKENEVYNIIKDKLEQKTQNLK